VNKESRAFSVSSILLKLSSLVFHESLLDEPTNFDGTSSLHRTDDTKNWL